MLKVVKLTCRTGIGSYVKLMLKLSTTSRPTRRKMVALFKDIYDNYASKCHVLHSIRKKKINIT